MKALAHLKKDKVILMKDGVKGKNLHSNLHYTMLSLTEHRKKKLKDDSVLKSYIPRQISFKKNV